jgi:hypothetical protein
MALGGALAAFLLAWGVFSSWKFFVFGCCSTFVCICQLESNYELIRLKNASRGFLSNCVINFFSSIFNTRCMYQTLWRKILKTFRTKHGLGCSLSLHGTSDGGPGTPPDLPVGPPCPIGTSTPVHSL